VFIVRHVKHKKSVKNLLNGSYIMWRSLLRLFSASAHLFNTLLCMWFYGILYLVGLPEVTHGVGGKYKSCHLLGFRHIFLIHHSTCTLRAKS
jgi:hypothetical protein